MIRLMFVFLLLVAHGWAQGWPFGSGEARRIVRGTTLPTSCGIGDVFFETDATAGQNIWLCTAANTWTQIVGSSTALTGAATSGADNTVMRSVGDSRAMEGTGVTISDTHQVIAPGGFSSLGITAGIAQYYEASANGSNYVAWKAPDSLGADTTYLIPSTPPSGNQVLQCGTPSGGVSTCSFTSSASAAARYTFQGTTQAGQNAWNMSYAALTNMVWSTVDATNITPMLVVTANTSGSALRSVTPVTSTNPTITFQATVRSTDATNSGSIALSYSCVPSGDSVNNPTFTGLTALTLATIDPDSEVFESAQAVTCTGTSAAPARLYVTWTPTAPSGGTLSLISFALVY